MSSENERRSSVKDDTLPMSWAAEIVTSKLPWDLKVITSLCHSGNGKVSLAAVKD